MPDLELFPQPEPEAPTPASPPEPGACFAVVAPVVPLQRRFSYLVPAALAEGLQVGMRVRVPFGGRALPAFVLELSERCQLPLARLKPIQGRIDEEPVVSPDVLRLAEWAADYYHCALGEMLAAAIPKGVGTAGRPRPRPARVRRSEVPPSGRLGSAQRRALEALAEGPRSRTELRGLGIAPAVLRRLAERGLVIIEELEEVPSPPASPARLQLTTEQELALRPILQRLEAGEGGTTLLFGVTGSGKTEVYLRAIARVLDQGRSAIVLVPEIALTPQTLSRFRERFGEVVAVLHSQLAGRRRRDEWRRVQRGEARVVVGPRSAVWAPVRALGLIVVDEEHETTYKQESSPRYHARDLAVVRGKQAGVPVILGSATPSLESYRNAQRGRYRMARLRTRPAGSELPEVRIVDMGREWAEIKRATLLSRVLMRELQRALARGERALLFQNRRGFTTFLQCTACGYVLKCAQCDITLTYHRQQGATLCHFCDAHHPPPAGPCPDCLGPPLRQRGAGTERIEEVVRACFPETAIARLDTDVVRGGTSPEEILERFRRGDISVLIGTQMIAKGLDIPEVTVVGVVSADTSLALPDFRAAERTFQLIAQVAGRAGRGRRPGCTIVQTFLPEHFALRAAAQHRFEAFAEEELRARNSLHYPPFRRLLKVLVRGRDAERVEAEAAALTELVRRLDPGGDPLRVLGPAPSPRAYLTGKYRWQFLCKGGAGALRRVIVALSARKLPSGVERILDVDPFHLL